MTARMRSPGRVAFGARLFLARQHRLDASDLDDQVAVLEALHRAVDHFADAIVVLGEDVLALGLAHLLEDHLLGGLRRDPAEHVGALRELDLHVDFGFFAVELLRFLQRDLGRVVGHVGHDVLDGEQIDLAGFLIEPRLQVLVRLVVLARRRQDGVLDRGDDRVGLDAFFLGERLDRLHQRVLHMFKNFLKLHFEPAARDQPQRQPVHAARSALRAGPRRPSTPRSRPSNAFWLSTASLTTTFASRPANRR